MPDLSDSDALVVGGIQYAVGWSQPLAVAAPAAGVLTVGRQVPGETWERFMLARASFTASAVVGNRLITVQFIDYQGNVYFEAPVSGTVVASTVVTVNLARGIVPAVLAAGVSLACIPDVLLMPGYTMRLVASGGTDVGDQWSAMNMYIQRFPSDAVQQGYAG